MKIAILGFGIVGSGAYEVLAHSGSGIEVKRVLDIRDNDAIKDKLTKNIEDILSDDEIKIVAETMGGTTPAYEYVSACLKAGKSVVTSNKMLVATYYEELMAAAREGGATLRFSAAAGGGIPWLSNIIRRSATEKIRGLYGIINGTTNYILDSMNTRGADFSDALAEAQALGYAERDPSADIDGFDIMYKCSISASCAFGTHLSYEDIPVMSLRHIKKQDMDHAKKNGMGVKYMIFASRNSNGTFSAYAEPAMISAESLESAVKLNNNFISLFCEYSGKLSFYGQGAGKHPTGAAVAYDVIETASTESFKLRCDGRAEVDNKDAYHRYYIRTKEKLPCVEKMAETYIKDGSFFVAVTRDMNVKDAHALLECAKNKDPEVFFAGIHPEV